MQKAGPLFALQTECEVSDRVMPLLSSSATGDRAYPATDALASFRFLCTPFKGRGAPAMPGRIVREGAGLRPGLCSQHPELPKTTA